MRQPYVLLRSLCANLKDQHRLQKTIHVEECKHNTTEQNYTDHSADKMTCAGLATSGGLHPGTRLGWAAATGVGLDHGTGLGWAGLGFGGEGAWITSRAKESIKHPSSASTVWGI